MLTSALLYAGLVPLVASAIASLLLRRLGAPPRIIWPVAIAVGFLAGQLAIRSEAGLIAALYRFIQPREAVDWLPLIVLLALGVTAVMKFHPLPLGEGRGEGDSSGGNAPSPCPLPRGEGFKVGRLRMLALAATFSLAVPVRLLSGNVRLTHHWSVLEKFAYLALLAGTLGVVWLLLATETEEEPAVLRVPLLILIAVCSAIVVTQSGAFVNGLSCGAVAAAIAGTALPFAIQPSGTGLRRFSFPGVSAVAGVLTFSLGSLILLAYFYAYLTVLNAVLLFTSLAATGTPLPDFLRRRPVWQQFAARMVLCVLPLAIALIRRS